MRTANIIFIIGMLALIITLIVLDVSLVMAVVRQQ